MQLAVLEQRLRIFILESHVPVAGHVLADRAAEELVDGHPERTSFDVPERDVDRRNRGAEDAVSREETRAE